MAGAKKLMQFHCTRIHIQMNLNQIYKSIKRCIKIPGIIEDYHIQCNVIIWIKNRYWWCHASCRFHQDKMDVKRIEMGLTARGTRSRSFDCAFLVNDAKFSRCQQNVKASRRSPPKPLRGIGRCSSVVILRISIERRTHVDAEDPEKKRKSNRELTFLRQEARTWVRPCSLPGSPSVAARSRWKSATWSPATWFGQWKSAFQG